MKILYSALTEHFWTHITEVVNNMAELGHEVHVAGFLRTRPKRLHPSVAFYNITLRNRGWREFSDLVFWREFLRWGRKRLSAGTRCSFYECWLEDIMDTVPFDLVYERNCISNPAIALANKLGVPSILEFNGIWPLESEWKGYPADEIRSFLDQEVSAAKRATRVICVSKNARDYYVAQGIDVGKFQVVPNGVNPDLFRPMNKRQCRERLGLPLDESVIGFSGSLNIYYEMEQVIQALPLILERFPCARLVIVGRDYKPPWGIGRDVLRVLSQRADVEERVELLDVAPYEEVVHYINSFDVCLLPLALRTEIGQTGAPLKFREYLACGRPVVASDVPGDVQILKGIEAGLLYKPSDPQDLAEKVCTILENPALAYRMADNGRRYVLAHSTWRHVTKRIMTIAGEIVASSTMQPSGYLRTSTI